MSGSEVAAIDGDLAGYEGIDEVGFARLLAERAGNAVGVIERVRRAEMASTVMDDIA